MTDVIESPEPSGLAHPKSLNFEDAAVRKEMLRLARLDAEHAHSAPCDPEARKIHFGRGFILGHCIGAIALGATLIVGEHVGTGAGMIVGVLFGTAPILWAAR